MITERDYYNIINTARKTGKTEGMSAGMRQGLQKGLQQGLRQGMENGETVSLAYKPSQLVGQYFEIVEA